MTWQSSQFTPEQLGKWRRSQPEPDNPHYIAEGAEAFEGLWASFLETVTCPYPNNSPEAINWWRGLQNARLCPGCPATYSVPR